VRTTSERRGSALDLSLLTDGLSAEREQGITIDVAYRYFGTPHRKFIIADAPGHEQYTRNMVTAASTADAAVLLVDARHGIVTQTRRHATLAHLLAVPTLIVAVNKMDLVGWDEGVYARIVDDFKAFARRTGIGEPLFVPLSAAAGDMVVDRGDNLPWYAGPTLLQMLETIEVQDRLAGAAFRYPVQYVARPVAGEPRRYLGRVEAGSIAVGDAVTILPSGRTTRIRAIRTWNGELARATLHASVGLVLDDEIDISRGDLIVASADAPAPSQQLRANVCWLAEAPLDARRTYVLRHATREVRARVSSIESAWNIATQQDEPAPATLATNAIARIQLALAQPVAVDTYRWHRPTGSFILVDETTNNTVAAGMVL
jgi:sulfate adenylyltransferase subunit 1